LLYLPIGIQLAHAFENHKHHGVCSSIDESHYHEDKVDCDFLHKIIPIVHYDNVEAFVSVEHNFLYADSLYKEVHLTSIHNQTLFTRGPPFFNLLQTIL